MIEWVAEIVPGLHRAINHYAPNQPRADRRVPGRRVERKRDGASGASAAAIRGVTAPAPSRHAGPRPRRALDRGHLAQAPAQLPDAGATRQLRPSGARAGLAGLHRISSAHHRLLVLPREPSRPPGAAARAGPAGAQAATAVLRI